MGLSSDTLGVVSFGVRTSMESLSASLLRPPSKLLLTTSETLRTDIARLNGPATLVAEDIWLIGVMSVEAFRSATERTEPGRLARFECTKWVADVTISSNSCASSEVSCCREVTEERRLMGLRTAVGVKEAWLAGVSSGVSYPSAVEVMTVELREFRSASESESRCEWSTVDAGRLPGRVALYGVRSCDVVGEEGRLAGVTSNSWEDWSSGLGEAPTVFELGGGVVAMVVSVSSGRAG